MLLKCHVPHTRICRSSRNSIILLIYPKPSLQACLVPKSLIDREENVKSLKIYSSICYIPIWTGSSLAFRTCFGSVLTSRWRTRCIFYRQRQCTLHLQTRFSTRSGGTQLLRHPDRFPPIDKPADVIQAHRTPSLDRLFPFHFVSIVSSSFILSEADLPSSPIVRQPLCHHHHAGCHQATARQGRHQRRRVCLVVAGLFDSTLIAIREIRRKAFNEGSIKSIVQHSFGNLDILPRRKQEARHPLPQRLRPRHHPGLPAGSAPRPPT